MKLYYHFIELAVTLPGVFRWKGVADSTFLVSYYSYRFESGWMILAFEN